MPLRKKWASGIGVPMPSAPKLQAVSFDSLAERFLASRQVDDVSPLTIVFYKACLRPLLVWTTSEGITPDQFGPAQLTAFLAGLQLAGKRPGFGHKKAGGPLKPATLDTYRRTIRAVLNFAAQQGEIEAAYVFPKAKTKRPKPKFLTDDELQRLTDAAEDPRDRALIAFLCDSACRRAECAALSWGDITLDGEIAVVNIEHGKGDRQRETYITRPTYDLLMAYGADFIRKDHSPVWVDKKGRRLTGNGIRQIFRRLSARSGVRAHPHLMRHLAAKRMLGQGMPIVGVQAALGHASVQLTGDLYGRYAPSMAREAFRKAMG